MADPIRSLAAIAECPIACVPNAGLPDENGRYGETPSTWPRSSSASWPRAGSTRSAAAAARPPRTSRPSPRSRRAFRRACRWPRAGPRFRDRVPVAREERRPLQVGERTNVIGSRKFKKLIAEGDFERAAEVGRAQVKGGAHILDVCLADPDRDEAADTGKLLDALTRMVRVR